MRVNLLYIIAELPILLVVLTTAFVLFTLEAPFIIWVAVYGGASAIWSFSQAIKYILRTERPLGSYKEGFAFPSGHTTLMLSLALLLLPVSFFAGVNLCVLALISGWARVRARVHYARDVLGSAIISMAGVFFVQYVISSIV